MEQQNLSEPQGGWPTPPAEPAAAYPMGGKALIFGLLCCVDGLLLCNSVIFGGFNLGFAIFAGISILSAALYLLTNGCRFTLYSGCLLGLSFLICTGFAYSDDGFIKFVMLCFLLLSSNLGLCLLAGQNRRQPGGVSSVLDAFRAAFSLGMGKLSPCFRGLVQAFRRSGTAGKKGGAVVVGLLVAVPLLAIVISLLIRADAAFDALLQLLPQTKDYELIPTVFFGSLLVCWLFCRGISLGHAPKPVSTEAGKQKGVNKLTVNTVLCAVALVYGVYLLSQLAYFSGGFSGILPAGYSMAEYARRGFFEMAWLCAINLGVIALSVGLVKKEASPPLSTRLFCLFLGLVTLFLVCTASAKMFLYIGSYGLTRLRVLTEVIMVFLAITTVLVCVWLFLPRLPYMKAVLLIGLVMGAAVFWTDVDAVVAGYNVTAYQSGRLETVDMEHLSSLGCGAVPYIQLLEQDSDPKVARQAKAILQDRQITTAEDYRGWNYVNHIAGQLLNGNRP